MESCTASSPYTFLMNPDNTTQYCHRVLDILTMLTPTQPDVLAGPGHVIVVCKVPLQPGLHPRPLVLPLPALHVHHQRHGGGVHADGGPQSLGLGKL